MIINKEGSITFWIDPNKNEKAFKDNNKVFWTKFNLNGVEVSVTSEGTVFLFEFNKRTKDEISIFKTDFELHKDKKTFVALTWSNNQICLYIDGVISEKVNPIDL